MEVLRAVATTLRFPAPGDDPVELVDPKVTITRDSDGGVVIDDEEATEVEGIEEEKTGIWEIELKGSGIPEADLLTAVWSDGDSTYTSQYEVVGGWATSLAAITEKIDEDDSDLTVDQKARSREIATREIEAACGLAFRPRYAREVVSGRGTTRLLLRHRRLLKVLAVSINGTALSEAEVEALSIDSLGVIIRAANWPVGRSNISVAYVHGGEDQAARLPVTDLAAYYLLQRPSDLHERATSLSTQDGTYSLVTPGVRGAQFPIPSVNAFVEGHGAPLVA